MKLPAELERLLEFIPEAEREAERQRLTSLHEGVLRQEDYSRKMNEVNQKHQKNLEWYNTAQSQYEAAIAERNEAMQRLTELEAAADSAGTRGGLPGQGGDQEGLKALNAELKRAREDASAAQKKIQELSGTVETFKKDITEGKYLTKEQFEADLTRRGDALGAAVLAVIDYQNEYLRDYGTPLDRQALLDEAQKRNGDIKAAYEFLTVKPREEKLRREISEQKDKEWSEKLKATNTPYDTTPGDSMLGPLQKRLQNKGDEGIPEDVKADGSGRLGQILGAQLRSEGKVI